MGAGMMNVYRAGRPGNARRAFVRRTGGLLAGLWAAGRWAVARAQAYPQTVAALSYAFQRETDAHRHYAAFAGAAQKEGYRGIAYMFTAFATSEGIHAQNFKDLVTRLGGEVVAAPTPIKTGATKQNLIAAVDDEIDAIDNLYPRTLERMQPEGHGEAAKLVKYAWASERQHRELIQKIRRYTPMLFESVAKTIDEKTGQYFVCGTCGSTLNEIPNPNCPVCSGPPARYQQVPIPG